MVLVVTRNRFDTGKQVFYSRTLFSWLDSVPMEEDNSDSSDSRLKGTVVGRWTEKVEGGFGLFVDGRYDLASSLVGWRWREANVAYHRHLLPKKGEGGEPKPPTIIDGQWEASRLPVFCVRRCDGQTAVDPTTVVDR